METNINWEAVRVHMWCSDWEDTHDGDRQERRVFLGTVFSLTPSGKYYLPFACSNVTPCDACHGSGSFPAHRKRRIIKKWAACNARRARMLRRAYAAGLSYEQIKDRLPRVRNLTVTCDNCGGVGSREAYLDELFNEKLEAEAHAQGFGIENGEGDPCDIFAVEYRDAPEETEEIKETGANA